VSNAYRSNYNTSSYNSNNYNNGNYSSSNWNRNPRDRRVGGGNRNSGGNNYRDSNRAASWSSSPSGNQRGGNKRSWSRDDNQGYQSNKRLKSSYYHIPLSTIIFATPGDAEGKAPQLVCGRFYSCNREAKLSTNSHYLQLNITRRAKRQGDRVSIPVPLDSIETVSVLSGMNPFEEMLKALSEKRALETSIERWGKQVIERRSAYEEKAGELQSMPEVAADEPQDLTGEVKEECQNPATAMDTEPIVTEAKVDGQEGAVEEEEEVKEMTVEEVQAERAKREEIERQQKELADERERLRKEKEEKREQRSQMVALVEKLRLSLDEAEQGLAADRQKLEKIDQEFGAQLMMFQDGKEGVEEAFLEELRRPQSTEPKNSNIEEGGITGLPEPANSADAVTAQPAAQVGVAMEVPTNQAGYEDANQAPLIQETYENANQAPLIQETYGNADQAPLIQETYGNANQAPVIQETYANANQAPVIQETYENAIQAPVIQVGYEDANQAPVIQEGYMAANTAMAQEGYANGKQVTSVHEAYTGNNQETELKKQDVFPDIASMPVRVILNLKKPLEKFYASNPKNSIIDKEVVEKTSMIVMECNVKQNEDFYVKVLNEVFEGPWKEIRRRPAELPSLPYPLEKTVQYLLKLHKRQDVSDNTVENCQLCETPLKRMFMAKHVKEFCQMREEPCRFCNEVFVMKAMSEHHSTVCPNFPVSCPQRCFGGKHKRCEVEEHLKTCMNSVMKCRFSSLGCSATLKRKQLRRHMFDEAHKHIDLLEKRMEKMTNYLLEKDPKLLELLNPPEPPSIIQEEEPKQEEKGEMVQDSNEGATEAIEP